MGRGAFAWLFLVAVAGSAAAESGHDSRLAEAAARIVAENIGPLRTNLRRGETRRLFDNGVLPEAAGETTAGRDPATRRPRPGEWHRGLALAVEGRRTVSPEL